MGMADSGEANHEQFKGIYNEDIKRENWNGKSGEGRSAGGGWKVARGGSHRRRNGGRATVSALNRATRSTRRATRACKRATEMLSTYRSSKWPRASDVLSYSRCSLSPRELGATTLRLSQPLRPVQCRYL